MQAIIVDTQGHLSVEARPDSSLGAGQVLIDVICAPVNPADRMQIAGTYIVRKEPPFIPGVVGVGRVVDVNGAGLLGRFLRDRTVVFAPGPDLPGTWAERAVAPAAQCIPLPRKLKPEEAVNLLANAMTATALIEEAKAARSPALVLTGAAGELGRMLNAVGPKRGVKIVSVVRREDQAQSLRDAGARHVVVIADGEANDAERAALREAVKATGARIAGDAVAGAMPELLLDALPDGGELISFGRLSGAPLSFDPMRFLVGKHQVVRGFDIGRWLETRGKLAQLRAVRQATDILTNGFRTKVQAAVDLDELAARFEELGRAQSSGKTVVYPNGVPAG